MTETLGELLMTACRRYGDRVAITARGEVRTYGDLLKRGSRLANALEASGVMPGQHVAAMLEDLADAFVVYVGCAMGGYPVVHVNDRLSAREVEAILIDSGAAAFIHTEGLSAEVARINGLDDLGVVVTIGSERSPNALGFENSSPGRRAVHPQARSDRMVWQSLAIRAEPRECPRG